VMTEIASAVFRLVASLRMVGMVERSVLKLLPVNILYGEVTYVKHI
jgi:hypothetical protein